MRSSVLPSEKTPGSNDHDDEIGRIDPHVLEGGHGHIRHPLKIKGIGKGIKKSFLKFKKFVLEEIFREKTDIEITDEMADIQKRITVTAQELNIALAEHSTTSKKIRKEILDGSDTLRNLNLGMDKFIEYSRKYSEDIIHNFSERMKKGTLTASKVIDSLHIKARGGRVLTHIAALAGTTGVLWMIPRLYQQTNKFPGVNGIDGEKPEKDNFVTKIMKKRHGRKEGV